MPKVDALVSRPLAEACAYRGDPRRSQQYKPCTQGLMEVARFGQHCRCIFPGGPVHDILGGGHEQVRDVIVAVGDFPPVIVIVIVIVIGLIYLAGVGVLQCCHCVAFS